MNEYVNLINKPALKTGAGLLYGGGKSRRFGELYG